MSRGVLLNVGSRKDDSNGQGRILRDLRFEYLPVEEKEPIRRGHRVPTYSDLGFSDVKYPGKLVHYDPEFKTFTYGHMTRGFGDQLLYNPVKDSIRMLFFYANLESDGRWTSYVIGYFNKVRTIDCRSLTAKKILSLSRRGFSNNAHLKRLDPQVHFLFRGGKGSRLLDRAFRLTERKDGRRLAPSLTKVIRTSTGRRIPAGQPWYRWTMLCTDCEAMLRLIPHTTKPSVF